jgi:hypothetical protein
LLHHFGSMPSAILRSRSRLALSDSGAAIDRAAAQSFGRLGTN